MDTSVQCLPERILVHYQFQMLNFRRLGQLIVTPEIIPKKIKAMKDNKSPGVDGIPSKLLMERVEQISTPLARVLNLSLKAVEESNQWQPILICTIWTVGCESIALTSNTQNCVYSSTTSVEGSKQ